MVPDNNVPLREAGTIQTTAGGATAATYTMVFEERNSTTALTTTSGNLDPDAAQFSVASVYGPATPIGSGAYAQTKGSLISLNLQYSAATGASAAVSTVYAIWQM